jgi:caa(3)-type oxidase subunit IV
VSASRERLPQDSRPDPVRRYLRTLFALLALLAVTAIAALIPLGRWNTPIGLGISVGKALLVMGIFMHESEARALTRLASSLGFIWLSALMGLLLLDFATRVWVPRPW